MKRTQKYDYANFKLLSHYSFCNNENNLPSHKKLVGSRHITYKHQGADVTNLYLVNSITSADNDLVNNFPSREI